MTLLVHLLCNAAARVLLSRLEILNLKKGRGANFNLLPSLLIEC
jgi:hypothetical protein